MKGNFLDVFGVGGWKHRPDNKHKRNFGIKLGAGPLFALLILLIILLIILNLDNDFTNKPRYLKLITQYELEVDTIIHSNYSFKEVDKTVTADTITSLYLVQEFHKAEPLKDVIIKVTQYNEQFVSKSLSFNRFKKQKMATVFFDGEKFVIPK